MQNIAGPETLLHPNTNPLIQARALRSDARRPLFKCDRFHQIAWSVHIQPFFDRHVVREQLQRHNFQKRQKKFGSMRNEDGITRADCCLNPRMLARFFS